MFWLRRRSMLSAPLPPAPITAMLTLSLGDRRRAAPRLGPASAKADVPAAAPISPRRVSPARSAAIALPLRSPVSRAIWPRVGPAWQGCAGARSAQPAHAAELVAVEVARAARS